MIREPTKEDFVKTWPGGYRENFDVYSETSGVSEREIVRTCLEPFFNWKEIVVEIGCGACYWPQNYLCQNFGHVIGLDVIPEPPFRARNFTFIEVPDRDYSCHRVGTGIAGFVWSFGVFCHLRLDCIAQYVKSAYRVLAPGGKAVLYFSNIDRRPGTATAEGTTDGIIWCRNDLKTSIEMMEHAGFTNIKDLMPDLHDTILYGEKHGK